jgi:apolipoprotein N-acyltransferase
VISIFLLWSYRYEQAQVKLIDDAPRLKVGLVQPNLDPVEDFRDEKVSVNIAKYREVTADLLSREQPDVVVWAESSVGLTYYSNHSQIDRGMRGDPMPGLSIPLVFGGQATAGNVNGKPGYYTSIFVMEPSGRIPAIYHKQELLSISEKPVLGSDRFVSRSFTILPGQNQEPLHWMHSGREYKVAAIICYEDLWSGVFATLIDRNPDFLLVVTNDSWFLQTIAPKQHAYVARWRAIEFGRSLVRATNDGVSLAVDGLGRSILELEPFVVTNGVADIPLAKSQTLFAVYGSLILWTLLGGFLLLSFVFPRF